MGSIDKKNPEVEDLVPLSWMKHSYSSENEDKNTPFLWQDMSGNTSGGFSRICGQHKKVLEIRREIPKGSREILGNI
jgi:hypothetical protein